MRRGTTNDKIASVLAAIAILVVAAAHAWVAVAPAPTPVVVPVTSPVPVATPAVPAPAPSPVVVPATPPAEPKAEPELVIVTDATGKRITDKAIEEVAGKLAVGKWRVEAIPKPGDTGWQRWIVVSDESKPPPVPPPPIPPGPTPPAVPPVVPPVVTVTATSATLVYEKDIHPVPSPVMAGLNRLNRERKILATLHEVDTTDGTDQIPDQYKVAVVAAKEAAGVDDQGRIKVPVLVVTAGSVVVKVLKDPRTEEDVMGAAL